MQNAEDDSFVDVDEDSYSEREEEIVPQERKRKERKDAEERKQENQLLDKIKTAMAENKGDIELGEDEAYCEACCLKLNGDMDISVLVWERTDLQTHIESSSHLARLKVLFKSNLFSSSRPFCGIRFICRQQECVYDMLRLLRHARAPVPLFLRCHELGSITASSVDMPTMPP